MNKEPKKISIWIASISVVIVGILIILSPYNIGGFLAAVISMIFGVLMGSLSEWILNRNNNTKKKLTI